VPRRTSKPPQVPVLDAGLRLLGRRAHSRYELVRKLQRRGYQEDEVDGAMTRLAELGYLNDQAFADGHIRRRSRSLGPLALSAELAARGVARETADRAVASLGPAEQLDAAVILVGRLAGRKQAASYRELLDSAGPKLLRRGFSPGIAREACRAVWVGTLDTPEA
jgi:regulatory protein